MGDCASRPSQSELSSHASESHPQNNESFIYLSTADLPHSVPLLKSQYLYFQRKKQEFEEKALFSFVSSSYLYVIEVQRLVHINQPGLCYSHERPYITVSLCPNGPYQETSLSDCYRPKWYRLMKFKTKLAFESLLLEVKGEKGFEFGQVSVKVDSRCQGVRDEWVGFEDGMKVKVRVQVISDEKRLFQDLSKVAEDKMRRISEMIKDKVME